MRIESKLCHISENKAIVQVIGWLDDKNIGSALAEGSTVEIAEDNAILRLHKRISSLKDNEVSKKNINKLDNLKKIELPINEKHEIKNNIEDPIDWSNELTKIDLEIKRLNWTRDDEINYLQTNLGYNSRNKITNYKQLINYLNMLKQIGGSNLSEQYNSTINMLIEDSDRLLKELSWDHKKGREYLQSEFNVSTRKELSEKQLISFVSKLKTIRNQYLSE